MRPDLERLLAVHGLAHLLPVLRAEGIDLDVLDALTESDLARCGVNLGDRKRLLKAIASLPPPERSTAFRGTAEPARAQRRTLTVLFADLVGFTALSSRIDPEDLRAAVRDFQQAFRTVVERYEGAIAQYLGDGILAYFGFPRAHEDDAERATRAGIEAGAAVSALRASDGTALAARVGIASGLVVVGDVVGTELIGGQAAIGETPNLAARMQSLAGPGEVIVAPSTRRLLRNRFRLEFLDETRVKGVDDPIRPSRVLGTIEPVSRFEADVGPRPIPMYGRSFELETLAAAWSDACAGHGRIVHVSGEAGVGKSRLCFELRQRVADMASTEVLLQCSAHHGGSLWYPLARWVEQACAIDPGDRHETRLEKLEHWVENRTRGPRTTADQVLPVLARVLSVPGGPALAGPPQAQRATIQATLARWLLDTAEREPMLLLVEDAHWIDPTTAELLGSVRQLLGDASALMLVTSRDGDLPAWIQGPSTKCVLLERLGAAEGRRLVDAIRGERRLPDDVVARILDKADGVPLFLEETTRGALDAQAAGAPWIGALPIPATLQELLLARLQGLADVMPFVQAGAAIGREFRLSLIAGVVRWSAEQVAAAAGRAEQAGLLERHGLGPETVHVFRHALIQDAAYSTLLLVTRREIHGRIADVLESSFPERCEAEPEVLAHHLTAAGQGLRAIGQWERAADHALTRFAGAEAIAHLTAALALVVGDAGAALAATARARRELALLLKLGPVVMTIRATGSGEPERIYRRVADLAREVGTLDEQFVAAFHLWYIYDAQARHTLAESIVGDVHRLAAASATDELLVQAGHADWTTSFVRGAFTRCLRATEEGLARAPKEDRHFRIDLFAGHDPMICALGHRALAEWSLGEFERAAASVASLRRASATATHVPSRILADYIAAGVALMDRDPDFARAVADPALALCRKFGVKRYEGVFGVLSGWASCLQACDPQALEQMEVAVALIESMGMVARLPSWYAALADACLATGQLERASRAIAQTIDAIERQGEESSRPWALSSRARIRAAMGQPTEAETDFREAIDVATRLGGKGWVLRTTRDYGEFLESEGRIAEAVRVLAPLCADYAPSAPSRDLAGARRLLERHRE